MPASLVQTTRDGKRPTAAELSRHSATFESRSPQDLLRWALERWRDRLVLCTSFQAEGMVLLDMAWRIDPTIRVTTLDTGRLPQATHDIMDLVHTRYGIKVEVHHPHASDLAPLLERHGPNGFYRDHAARRACCHARKVAPLKRALADVDAWITGLRRDQTPQRANTPKIAYDADHGPRGGGIAKLSPLAHWGWRQVWDYIQLNDVPHHAYYDQGYTSIGCAPCTRPVHPGADPRAGRWWWEQGEHKECGLHLAPSTPAERPLTVLPGGYP